jgi:hypothetical protein
MGFWIEYFLGTLGHTPELKIIQNPISTTTIEQCVKKESEQLWRIGGGQDQYKIDLSVPEFQTSSVACMQQAKIDHVHRAPF